MPKVTIIIPNYNHAKFLDVRIQSILKQTYQDYEVIFLDDASIDDSLAVFAKYADDPRIRIIQNQVNSGNPFKQWNKGVREAKGEYVWIAESDDYADPHLLEVLIAQIEQNPNVGLAYCQSLAVDMNGAPLYNFEYWTADLDATRWKTDFINDGRDECQKYIIVKNTIPNASAVVFRKCIYELVNGADENYRTCADWLLWAEILSHSDIAFVAQTLNYFRRHSSSVIQQNQNTLLGPMESYRVLENIKQLVSPGVRSHRMACDRQRKDWLSQIHGRTLDCKRWREHVGIHRIAKRVDKSINFWLLRRLLACAILGR